MNLESPFTTIQKSAANVFDFLTKIENFEHLMPDDKEKFEIDGDSFLFALKGMPEIRLVINKQEPFKLVQYGAASSKLSFTLDVAITEVSENSCDAKLQFNGEFNPMMAMMIKKPIQKFINTLSQNMNRI